MSLPLPWELIEDHNMDADTRESENQKNNEESTLAGASAGFLFAGLARASIYAFIKKGIIMLPKKKAFLKIGRLTTQTSVSADNASSVETKPRKGRLSKGIPRELAKSLVLGMTVFGTYDYLVLHHMSNNTESATDIKSPDSLSRERSTVLAHYAAGTCAGLVQSSVLTTWELVAKIQSHHMEFPHNLRTRFITRRAIHHSIGYASLFGTYEAIRRQLLHAAYPFMQSHHSTLLDTANANRTQELLSLTTAFVSGGIAGQVHQFVNYISSHWKMQALQRTTMDFSVSQHAKAYAPLPTIRANLSAFIPTGLCFIAFQYGEDFTVLLMEQHENRVVD